MPTRPPTSLAIACSAILASAFLFLPDSAFAQYLAPSDDNGGYLPERTRAWEPGLLSPHSDPVVAVGAAFDVGAAWTDLSALDTSYFGPNGGRQFGAFAPAHIEGSGWLEFSGHFRLGVQSGGLLGGNGRSYMTAGNGGLLFEGGGSVGPIWSFWGGTVLGFQSLYAESKDQLGNRYEYDARFLHARLQAHAEAELNDVIGLRITAWYSRDGLYREDFQAFVTQQDITPIFPADSDLHFHAGGLSLGIFFGPFH